MSKLDSRVQKAILTATGGDERTNVLMATHGQLTDEQRSALEDLECHVRDVTGDVVTLDLPVRRLSALAELDFTRYVELGRPMQLEKKND